MIDEFIKLANSDMHGLWARLNDVFSQPIGRHVIHLGCKRDDVDDVVQDVLLNALNPVATRLQQRRFNHDGALKSYLKTTAKRRLNRLRNKRRCAAFSDIDQFDPNRIADHLAEHPLADHTNDHQRSITIATSSAMEDRHAIALNIARFARPDSHRADKRFAVLSPAYSPAQLTKFRHTAKITLRRFVSEKVHVSDTPGLFHRTADWNQVSVFCEFLAKHDFVFANGYWKWLLGRTPNSRGEFPPIRHEKYPNITSYLGMLALNYAMYATRHENDLFARLCLNWASYFSLILLEPGWYLLFQRLLQNTRWQHFQDVAQAFRIIHPTWPTESDFSEWCGVGLGDCVEQASILRNCIVAPLPQWFWRYTPLTAPEDTRAGCERTTL